MPDILLIQPPVRDFYLTAKRTIPYGLACIASALRKEGFTVDIFDSLATSKSKTIDLPPEMDYLKKFFGLPDLSPFSLFHHFKHYGYSFEHIGTIARKSGAFLIGISSLFTAYSDEAIKCAESVKKFHPECKIVLGGHHPTEMPKTVMECRSIDFLIRGEGEVAMPLLARAIKAGVDLKEIPGIVYRQKDGTLHINEPAEMARLDDYPLPAMDLIKHSFYQRGSKASTVVISSRGCPMKCSYCCMGGSPLSYRRRKVESVIEEIETAIDAYDAKFIDFEDENLSLEREWFMQLLDAIVSRWGNAKLELRAMNGLFPPSLDEEMIMAMMNAGFSVLNLSLGSTSPHQLTKFKRPDVRSAVERALTHAEKYGLEAVCYIIVGAPGQKAEDSIEDLLYLCQRRVLAGVSVYYPAPGSLDFQSAAARELLPDHPALMRSSAIPISDTTTRLESLTLLRLGRILNFIKSLVDRGLPIPNPSPLKPSERLDCADRDVVGRRLLQWFLHDGIIRGITPSGAVYDHPTSTPLSRQFIEELKHIPIRGISSQRYMRYP